jgi:hypothetical protein
MGYNVMTKGCRLVILLTKCVHITGCRPLPLPLHEATAGKNHLNEEITPLLPTGIGERCCQTIAELIQGAL